jgi:hypothetical protein
VPLPSAPPLRSHSQLRKATDASAHLEAERARLSASLDELTATCHAEREALRSSHLELDRTQRRARKLDEELLQVP